MKFEQGEAETNGFIFKKDDERLTETPVPDFACVCAKCGSADVTLRYFFRYYGSMTGYNQDITLYCRNCDDNIWSASI